MPRSISLLVYPANPTHWNNRDHWSIFIPTDINHRTTGKVIHVVGSPFTGYGLEFRRNYDLTENGRHWRQFHLATVDDEHVEEWIITNGDTRSPTIDLTPAYVSPSRVVELSADEAEADMADHEVENDAGFAAAAGQELAPVRPVGTEHLHTYTSDTTPRDKLEREAAKISPPGISFEPMESDVVLSLPPSFPFFSYEICMKMSQKPHHEQPLKANPFYLAIRQNTLKTGLENMSLGWYFGKFSRRLRFKFSMTRRMQSMSNTTFESRNEYRQWDSSYTGGFADIL